jgi:RNA polymerase sigma-70 factor (ECF subfamily)
MSMMWLGSTRDSVFVIRCSSFVIGYSLGIRLSSFVIGQLGLFRLELFELALRPRTSNVSRDDPQLIHECLQGETAAFGELIARYQDRLYNTVYRLLDNAEDAQDVVQDAFLHAYQSLDSFKGDAQFFTWLYRIAVNTAISLKRKQKSAVRLQGGADAATNVEPLDLSPDSDPGRVLERTEQAARIQQALRRLSPEHRAVLIMKDVDDKKYEDMADFLDVPIGTIRSRLHRARLELRAILEAEEAGAVPKK